MTEINKDIEKYLSQVKSYLPCRNADKTAILEDIRQAIFEFADNNNVNSIDMIYSRFGTPEEIAKAYLSDADPKKITKTINRDKLLISFVAAALIIFIGFMTAVFIDSRIDRNGTLHITIEEGVSFIDIQAID